MQKGPRTVSGEWALSSYVIEAFEYVLKTSSIGRRLLAHMPLYMADEVRGLSCNVFTFSSLDGSSALFSENNKCEFKFCCEKQRRGLILESRWFTCNISLTTGKEILPKITL